MIKNDRLMNKIGKESLLNDMMYSLTQIPMKHGVSSPLPGALSSQKMQPSVSGWMALTNAGVGTAGRGVFKGCSTFSKSALSLSIAKICLPRLWHDLIEFPELQKKKTALVPTLKK